MLEVNISKLYTTARLELKRKDTEIVRLRRACVIILICLLCSELRFKLFDNAIRETESQFCSFLQCFRLYFDTILNPFNNCSCKRVFPFDLSNESLLMFQAGRKPTEVAGVSRAHQATA